MLLHILSILTVSALPCCAAPGCRPRWAARSASTRRTTSLTRGQCRAGACPRMKRPC